MCYNTRYMTQESKTYSSRYEIDVLQISAFPKMWWANGFDFPDIPVITNRDPDKIQAFSWGLIPFFTKLENLEKVRPRNLNARDDHVFKLPSWREPIKTRRCIIILDAYYEYHTYDKKTKIPYHFKLKDDPCLSVAGIYDTWKHGDMVRKTVALVTTDANDQVAKIHNNPEMLKRGNSRMPLILTRETEKLWLTIDATDKAGQEQLKELMHAVPANMMEYYTVPKLLGKHGVGNSEEATSRFQYEMEGLP